MRLKDIVARGPKKPPKPYAPSREEKDWGQDAVGLHEGDYPIVCPHCGYPGGENWGLGKRVAPNVDIGAGEGDCGNCHKKYKWLFVRSENDYYVCPIDYNGPQKGQIPVFDK